jgi:hypothetical protein
MYRLVEYIISIAKKSKIKYVGNFVKRTFAPHFNLDTLKNVDQKMLEVFTEKGVNKEFYFQVGAY